MNTFLDCIFHVVFNFDSSVSKATIFEFIDWREHFILKILSSGSILSSQDKIFKKSFCELIKKQAVLILIDSRDSGAAHIFKVVLYWSNIHHPYQALILRKLLYYHFVWSWLRSILKFIAVDLRVRIEYKELRARKFFKHTIHVVRYDLSRTFDYFFFLISRLEFLFIIFLFFFFGLNASLDIIDEMVKLCEDYSGEDSNVSKLWDQVFEMLNFGETARC